MNDGINSSIRSRIFDVDISNLKRSDFSIIG